MRRAFILILILAFHGLPSLAASSTDSTKPAPADRTYSDILPICGGADIGIRGLRTLGLQIPLWGDAPVSLRSALLPTLADILRSAGATVVLPGDPGFKELKDQIMVSLKMYRSSDAAQCAWGVDLDLHQPLFLQRDPTLQPTGSIAYHNWRMGIASCSEVEAVLRQNAIEFFGQFARFYEADNRRE